MAQLVGAPWRALAKIVLTNNATGGRRWFQLGVSPPVDASGDQSGWEANPGATLQLEVATGTTGVAPPEPPDTMRLQTRLPGGAQVGVEVTLGGGTQTLRFDDDPFDGVTGSPRSGMLEIYLEVERTTGTVTGRYGLTSRGTTFGDGVPAGHTHDWAQGYVRASFILSSHSVSNVSLGGAEPNPFAYPDPIFVRSTVNATAYESPTLTCRIIDQPSSVIRSKSMTSTTSPTRDASFNNTSGEKVDATFDNDSDDLHLLFSAADFGGDDKFTWATDINQPSGWVRDTSDRGLRNSARVPVNPIVTIVNNTSTSGGFTKVYNRGETISGTLEVENARNEKFTPQGNERVRTVDIGTNAVEETCTDSRAVTVVTWSRAFASSGNVAPATLAGAQKKLRWDDVQSGVTSPTADSAGVGFLSSLYQISRHMQLQTGFDPNQNTTERPSSEIGFYGLKVTNVRGDAVNGATGGHSLQDDNSVVSALVFNGLTTQNVNGNDGYTVLQQWTNALPGGGWDFWTHDPFTKDGNSGSLARSGAGVFDFTLLAAQNPFIQNVIGGGMAGDDEAEHFQPGKDLLVGLVLEHAQDDTILQPDDPPTPDIALLRFNTATGKAQYLTADEQTWADVGNTGSGDFTRFALSQSPGDSRVYIRTFDAVDTAFWSDADLFLVATAFYQSVAYPGHRLVVVTGDANQHHLYSFDPTGLFK